MSISYDYYPAILYAIGRIGLGRTRTRACDEANITVATFDSYVNRHPELQELLREEEQRGYDAMAEALLQPDNHGLYGHSDPKMAKVQSDNLKWFLAKKKPKEYGEKITIDHNITADKAITDALLAGRRRAQGLIEAPVVEADYTEITEDELIAQEIFAGI